MLKSIDFLFSQKTGRIELPNHISSFIVEDLLQSPEKVSSDLVFTFQGYITEKMLKNSNDE